MTLEGLKNMYRNGYVFHKLTGMSPSTYANWFRWGYIPWRAQLVLEVLTKGELKADIKEFK